MANVEAQGTKCLGLHLGHAGQTNANLVGAWTKMKASKPATTCNPRVSGHIDAPGVFCVFDLNVKPLEGKRSANNCVDVIPDVAGEYDWAEVRDLRNCTLQSLVPCALYPSFER